MKILVLPDIHLPYPNWSALKKVAKFNETYQADIIIQLGDLIDAKAWSRWPKDPDDDSAQAEWDKTHDAVLKLAKLFPEMTIILGNHDRRPMAKALEAGLPKQLVKTLGDVFAIPGWTWHIDSKPLVVDNIVFMHGDEMAGTPGQKASKLGKSVCQGHTHKASLTYVNTFQHQVFGMECGHIADINSIAFRYSAKNPVTSFTGFAVIDNGVPHLYPL